MKIHADVQVMEGVFKAPGGLVRATVRLAEGRVDDLELTGDFTLFPVAALVDLQQAARGAACDKATLSERFAAVYATRAIQAPGLMPEHLAAAVMAASAPAA